MKQGVLILLGMLAIAGAITFSAKLFTDLKTKEVEDLARYQCAQSSRYSVNQPNGATVWYPVEDLYKKCLEEKGIK